MTVVKHKIHLGDTLTPLYFRLVHFDDETKTYVATDLTGKRAFLRMEDEDSNDVVGPGTSSDNECVITSAADGEGYYDFIDTDVDERGTFYGYIMVYDGNERDTYPNEEKQLRIVIQ